MTAQDRKTEELIAKAFQTMLEKIIQTETKWNGEIVKGIAQQSKWIGVTSASITTSKEKTKQDRLAIKLSLQEEKAVKSKAVETARLVKFRSVFNIAREKEHGAQVRRNKELQHQLNNTGSGLQFLTNSIKGNFGFQAALGNITKSLNKGRTSFDALQQNTELMTDAQKRLDDVNRHGDFSDPEAKKLGEAEIKGLESERVRIKKRGGGIGTGETTKPLFNVLSKVGKFMEKKALPIGLGIGVAGILMSVIVKAFSASPLFAQMMKMMKFMVTLILMPIGTFFGALLRPILISLLRKVIVPLYATWMPAAMKWGSALGNWLVKENKPARKWGDDDNLENMGLLEQLSFLSNLDASELANIFNPPPVMAATDNGEDIVVDESTPDAGHSKASDYDFDATEVLETHDQEAIDLFAQSVAESERISKALEAAAEAGKAPTLEEVIEEMEKTAGARDGLSDESKARLDEVDKYKEQTINKLPEILIPEAIQTYAEKQAEKNASYGNMGIDSNDKRTGYALDIANREKQQAEHDEKQRIENERVAAIRAADPFSNEQAEVFDSNIIGGQGEFAGKTWENYIPAADGFSGMVNKPTMFLAGEAGSEHVNITPSGGSSGGGITVNIGTMNGSDNDLRKLKQTILEVIQQSSANRGRL